MLRRPRTRHGTCLLHHSFAVGDFSSFSSSSTLAFRACSYWSNVSDCCWHLRGCRVCQRGGLRWPLSGCVGERRVVSFAAALILQRFAIGTGVHAVCSRLRLVPYEAALCQAGVQVGFSVVGVAASTVVATAGLRTHSW